MQVPSGIIIILSYPDTIVRPAYWKRFSKFWSKIDVGKDHAGQTEYAALQLIKKPASKINYLDRRVSIIRLMHPVRLFWALY